MCVCVGARVYVGVGMCGGVGAWGWEQQQQRAGVWAVMAAATAPRNPARAPIRLPRKQYGICTAPPIPKTA